MTDYGAVSLGIADRLTSTMTRSTGLGSASTAALVTVLARSGTSMGDLATTLGISHPGAVRVVARLKTAHRGPLPERAVRAAEVLRRTLARLIGASPKEIVLANGLITVRGADSSGSKRSAGKSIVATTD